MPYPFFNINSVSCIAQLSKMCYIEVMRQTWTHNRFRCGEVVDTCFGVGKVVGIDLPQSQNAWRWLVEIVNPTRPIYGSPVLAFFDNELTGIENHK